MFRNSLSDDHPHLETSLRLRLPLIGIGAPAAVFLKRVAEKLHCDLVLPEHHRVANAAGAVAGSVVATEEVLVCPRLTDDGLDVLGYAVRTVEDNRMFDDLPEALSFARTLCRERVLGAAMRSGADTPKVIVGEREDGMDTYRIVAKAVVNPRLMRREKAHGT